MGIRRDLGRYWDEEIIWCLGDEKICRVMGKFVGVGIERPPLAWN